MRYQSKYVPYVFAQKRSSALLLAVAMLRTVCPYLSTHSISTFITSIAYFMNSKAAGCAFLAALCKNKDRLSSGLTVDVSRYFRDIRRSDFGC